MAVDPSDAVANKATRILGPLSAYRSGGLQRDIPGLSGFLGVYENTSPPADCVWIFADGLALERPGDLVVLRFVEIETVRGPSTTAADHPDSKFINVTRLGGGQVPIHIDGHRGRFLDSMDFTRFLNDACSIHRRASSR
ncbi:MAG: hypothetical protein ABMB14_31530 [Myxococcota bacterium]